MHRFILYKIGQLNQTHCFTYVMTLLGALMKRCDRSHLIQLAVQVWHKNQLEQRN